MYTVVPRRRTQGRRIAVAGLVLAACALSAEAQYIELDAALGEYDAALYADASAVRSGSYMETGDFNGDAVLDLVLARATGSEDRNRQGLIWIVYGPLGRGERDLTTVEPDVVILGADEVDFLGDTVAVADFDNDGVDDLVAVAFTADGPNNERLSPGELHLFYGGSLPARWDLALRPADVTVYGQFPNGVGASVAAGDIDDDGLADVLASTHGEEFGILYGRSVWPAVIDLAQQGWDTGIPGLFGTGGGGGNRQAMVVDLDGDGRQDILCGNPPAASKGANTGEIAIWFGRGARFPRVLDRTTEPPDVTVVGPYAQANVGEMFAVGDVDGDARNDLVVRAVTLRPDGRGAANEVFVVAGRSPWPRIVDLASDADAVVGGPDARGLGSTLQVADFDGDGVGDIAATEAYRDGPGGRTSAGRLLLWFGYPGLRGRFEEEAYPRTVALWAADSYDFLHAAHSLHVFRDLDDDGLADVVVNAIGGDGPGNIYAPDSPGDHLFLKGWRWERCCQLWRDASIRSLDPTFPPRSQLLPLDAGDCYRWRLVTGAADPEAGIASDASRPLVFYARSEPEAVLRLTKRGDAVVIHH
jgi:hypothetical protein